MKEKKERRKIEIALISLIFELLIVWHRSAVLALSCKQHACICNKMHGFPIQLCRRILLLYLVHHTHTHIRVAICEWHINNVAKQRMREIRIAAAESNQITYTKSLHKLISSSLFFHSPVEWKIYGRRTVHKRRCLVYIDAFGGTRN